MNNSTHQSFLYFRKSGKESHLNDLQHVLEILIEREYFLFSM